MAVVPTSGLFPSGLIPPHPSSSPFRPPPYRPEYPSSRPPHAPTHTSSFPFDHHQNTSVIAVPVVEPSWAPAPVRFHKNERPLSVSQVRDQYGYLRAYPQPFARGIESMGDLARFLNTNWGAVDMSIYGDLPDHTPPSKEVTVNEPTCFMSPSSASAATEALTLEQYNCTLACLDPQLLFEPLNFGTCMQLATTAMFMEDRKARVDSGDEATVAMASAIGFGTNLEGFNGSRVMEVTLECAAAGCRNKGKGICGTEVTQLQNTPMEPENLIHIYEVLEHYCDHAESIVNEDVAGPGVLTSYLVSCAVTLLLGMLTKLLTSLLRPLFWARYAMTMKDSPWEMSGKRQQRLSLSRASAAVICSLVELAEIQGFFVVAIQMATLITFRKDTGPDLNGMDSFGSLVFNSSLVQVLAVSGVLPVLLVQCCLQRAGMMWWYTLAIACVAFVLGIIVDTRGGYMLPPFQTVFDHFRSSSPLPQCGGNFSPLLYCNGKLPFLVSDDFGQMIAYFVLPSLVIHQVGHDVWRRYALERKARRWERSRPFARHLRRAVFPIVWNMYWIALQMILFIFTAMYFNNLFLLVFESTLLNDSNWTYGQLVAIMVWAPILGKYLYFNVFGIEEGFSRRLAKHYKVVHSEEPDDDDRGFDDDNDSLDGRHEAMEEGVELKDIPTTASGTTLRGEPSPGLASGTTETNSPVPSSPGPGSAPRPGPLAGPSSLIPVGTPTQQQQQQHPSYGPPYGYSPPIDEGLSEGITTAGGVVIAVENHDATGR